MNQRRGNWSDDNAPGLSDVLENPAFQFGSDRQANALLRGSIIDDALVTGVTVVAQDQRLQPKLHFIRVPQFILARAARAFISLSGRARLVVNRADLQRREQILLLRFRLDQVHLGDDAQALGTHLHGTRMNRFWLRVLRL